MITLITRICLVTFLAFAAAIAEGSGGIDGQLATPALADDLPEIIDLPNGWLPEGVISGNGPVVYAGSRANGAIYAADVNTGLGSILVAGQAGWVTTGLAFDSRTGYIFAAGANNGAGRVFDSTTGALLASYQFASAPTFINDVVLLGDAAYFTDSMQAALFRVDLGPDGSLPSSGDWSRLNLGGAYQHVAGFNINGIERTPDGNGLFVVQSSTGRLFNVNPHNGIASLVDIGGYSVTNGDGLRLVDNILYVIRNQNNRIAAFEMDEAGTWGAVVQEIFHPNFETPTTAAFLDGSLYVVQARFGVPSGPSVPFWIVRVRP